MQPTIGSRDAPNVPEHATAFTPVKPYGGATGSTTRNLSCSAATPQRSMTGGWQVIGVKHLSKQERRDMSLHELETPVMLAERIRYLRQRHRQATPGSNQRHRPPHRRSRP